MNRFVRSMSLIPLLLLAAASAHAAADLVPVYLDGPSEGFNDPGAPHGQSATDGNPGDTLGEQRKWAFEKALEFWEMRLDSNVNIRVEAEMNDLACDSTSAVLGSAGTIFIYRDWSPGAGGTAGRSSTWYGQALANKLANTDIDPTANDIESTFNKKIDESNSCLGSNVWYYALGDAPAGTTSFYKTALHEIGHGINFQTFVDLDTGEKVACGMTVCDDIYMVFLEDHSTAKDWPSMTNGERATSAEDTNDLHWTGTNVLASIGSLGSGTSGGHVEMYAPSPLEPGSSVSHWDTDADDTSGNSELMEPSATGTEKLTVTDELLHDMGWNDVPAGNCTFASDRITDSSRTITSTVVHNACVSVTLGNDLIVDSIGDLDVLAGHQIFIRNGFRVETGATFSAEVDPSIGL